MQLVKPKIKILKIETGVTKESPKQRKNIKITVRKPLIIKNKEYKKVPSVFYSMKKSLVKIAVLCLIVALNWTGLSAVIETFAYFNDVEDSPQNVLAAGTLDFYLLSSPDNFFPPTFTLGESATRTISLINIDNIPKYTVNAANFAGALCDYLNLEANLDGDGVEYSGKLIDFTYGPIVFEEPEDWTFTLTLPADAPETVLGETCQFNFVFFGSQVKNDLIFGQGFTDTEEIDNKIAAAFCYNAEMRSKGYWENHPGVYKPYLPQTLGDEIVSTVSDVTKILQTDYELSMRNKLKGQLLAMKFNVAHFGVGEYLVESQAKNINQIVAEADDLLKQTPEPPEEILEAMKNLLEGLIDTFDGKPFRYCTMSNVKVVVPNGGEVWWVGRHYDLTWTTKNLNCPSGLPYVSIWYSGDSGNTFANIVTNTENDGVYDWRIPLFLNGYYVPSDKARIKVVAKCSENLMVVGWDISDNDFCPPIDYDLLTPEELEMAKALGLLDGLVEVFDVANDEIPVSEEPVDSSGGENNVGGSTSQPAEQPTEQPTEQSAEQPTEPPVEEPSEQPSEEPSEEPSEMPAEPPAETPVEPGDELPIDELPTIGQPVGEEPLIEEPVVEEPVIEEPGDSTIEEPPVIDETPIIEEQPAVEEQPVIGPSDDSGNQSTPAENNSGSEGNSDGSSGSSGDAGSSGESTGASE